MPYRKIQRPRISDVIQTRLENLILSGDFKAGEKLPPERELAEKFGVSRPSVREAIQKLAAKGLLYSLQGGGNYVSDKLERSLNDPFLQLLSTHPEFQYDILEFRGALEGMAAHYAAIRATDEDKAKLKQRFDELVATYGKNDSATEAKADAAFHLAIAEAAKNVVLLHNMKMLFELFEQSIIDNLENLAKRSNAHAILYQQHLAILEAILRGDADAARAHSHEHLAFVENCLAELSRKESRFKRTLHHSL